MILKGKIQNFVVKSVSSIFTVLIIAVLFAFLACIAAALLAAIKFLVGI